MSVRDSIWVEKYRPKKIEDMILPSRVVNMVKNGITNHLLLYGGPGLGKTSLAKIIAKDHTYMYINCSVDTGVDVVRTKITEFCSNIGMSFDGSDSKQKIVILDEFDGVSDSYMKAMRGTIESFASTTKFVATCNYINKIPDYMQSRFDCVDFNFPKEDTPDLIKQYIMRIHTIAKEEGITVEPKAILKIVKNYFPDLRRTITFIQRSHSEGNTTITEEDLDKFSGEFVELYKLLFNTPKKDFFKIYSFVFKNYAKNEEAVFAALGSEFIDYIQKEQTEKTSLIGPIITQQSEWSYKSQFVADKICPLSALLYNIHLNIAK